MLHCPPPPGPPPPGPSPPNKNPALQESLAYVHAVPRPFSMSACRQCREWEPAVYRHSTRKCENCIKAVKGLL